MGGSRLNWTADQIRDSTKAVRLASFGVLLTAGLLTSDWRGESGSVSPGPKWQVGLTGSGAQVCWKTAMLGDSTDASAALMRWLLQRHHLPVLLNASADWFFWLEPDREIYGIQSIRGRLPMAVVLATL